MNKTERPGAGQLQGGRTLVEDHPHSIAQSKKGQGRWLIYLATPKDQYCHPLYAPAVAAVRSRFPDTEVFEPSKTGWTNAQWREEWRILQERISLLIIWPRNDRTIGAGCYQEIRDTQERGMPVLVLSRDRRLFALDRVELLAPGPMDSGNWRRFARVHRGDEVR